MNLEAPQKSTTVDIPGQPSGEHDADQSKQTGSIETEAQLKLTENPESPFEKALTNQDEATLAVIADLEAEAERARFAEELRPTVNSMQEVPAEEPAQHPLYSPARPPIPHPPRELGPYTRYEYIPAPEIQTPPQDAKGAFRRMYDHIRQRHEKRQLRKQEVRRAQDEAFFTELTPDERLDMQMTLGFSAAAFAVADQRKPYWMK